MATIEKGSDLMLFLKTGTGSSATTKSIAFATNHTLTINATTVETSHKDVGTSSGVTWTNETVQKLDWEVTTDNLFSLNGEGNNYDDLFNLMTQGKAIDGIFAKLSNHVDVPTGGYTAPTTGDGYKGKVIITNLVLNAPNGDNATFTATFRGVGALESL